MQLSASITALWSFAVFLASAFAATIVASTLKPRLAKVKTAFFWLLTAALGFSVTFAFYTLDITNDIVGILGLSALVCLATNFLYIESWSTKLFTSLMACLIANVCTFMFCGTTDAVLGGKLELFSTHPYTAGNILLFIIIKVVVYTIIYILYMKLLRHLVIKVSEELQGKMSAYLATPVASIIGFYIINYVTNNVLGILPNQSSFMMLYLPICLIFVIAYYQIFKSVFWSAKAMKNEAELGVASHIQADMLPSIFPAFPERNEFDIYATMNPAKEVGGDFYDFFLIDDDHLALVMADVSGKGVPASLFMVIAKTLLKTSAQSGLSPREILYKVNNQLCENNETMMFVTVWIGIYDIKTGKMICANAGHECPVIRRENGKYEIHNDEHGFVLAGMEDMQFDEYELNFNAGDRLFVYTDGVPESINLKEEQFGVDGMLNALNSHPEMTVSELLPALKNDIDIFANSADQFDDITMLGFDVKSIG